MTTERTAKARKTRLGLILMPLAASAGFVAAGFVISNDLAENAAISANLSVQSVTEIEFVSQPGNNVLQNALVEACAETGCDAPRTLSMVQSGLPHMTDAELEAALKGQALTLADLSVQIETGADGADAQMLEAQYLAESEITALYRAEFRKRARAN